MPAIFSSMYLLNPSISETTVTNAVTPTIMPSKVSAERSLCAQMAATATFRISMSFTGLYTQGNGKWLPTRQRAKRQGKGLRAKGKEPRAKSQGQRAEGK